MDIVRCWMLDVENVKKFLDVVGKKYAKLSKNEKNDQYGNQ